MRFENLPVNDSENQEPAAERHIVTQEWEFEDGNRTVRVEQIGKEVESAEVKQGAEELLKKFGGFLSAEEAIKYAHATPEQLSALEEAVKQREADYANGVRITNYGKLDI